MIQFYKKDDRIILSYTPEFTRVDDWVERKLGINKIILSKTFTFYQEDLFSTPKSSEEQIEDPFELEPTHFIFAILSGTYYKITRGILVNNFDIYISQDIVFNKSLFVADSNISIFRNIEALVNKDIYIGGNANNSIPFVEFQKVLNRFPNSYERKKYTEAKVSAIIRNYFEDVKDAEKTYQKYINNKWSKKGADLSKTFKEIELIKYQSILEKLEEMLNSEMLYSEKQWQNEILQIILLLYPKYISVFKEVPISDPKVGERFLDFLLIDSNGHVDIIEIKRPFDNAIVTANKYRNNFIPMRELSGTIMQLEKYIYFLNRWSHTGEKVLTDRYKADLPKNFEIKITNPNGIIIMGRDNELNNAQKQDFEVIKRKYKNVIDIITYDNLLLRLRYTIEQIKKN